MEYERHPKGRDNVRTFRLSKAELKLFRSTMGKRGFKIENHYVRFLIMQDAELVGDDALLSKVLAEEPTQTKLISLAPRSWDHVRAVLLGLVKADVAPPNWAVVMTTLASNQAITLEPPPVVCCREPLPECTGVGVVCAHCTSDLPPAAGAQLAAWRSRVASALGNVELSSTYARLADRLQQWANREEREPELRMMRLRFGRESSGNVGQAKDEAPPASSTTPKASPILRAARLRGGKTIIHIKQAEGNYAMCGVRVLDRDINPNDGIPCPNCARMDATQSVGAAA